MEEIWKDIEGYEGLYQVSSLGRVRGLERIDSIGRRIKGKIISLVPMKSGYLTVKLSKNGKIKGYLIHRLVAEAFIPNPNNLPQVGHKDETRDNNIASNLEWTTALDNDNMPKHRERISKSRKGTTLSDEHKRKIGNAVRGEKNGFYGHHLTKEHDELLKRINRSRRGELSASSKKVVCDGKIFVSLTECSTYLNLPLSTLSQYLKGRVKMPKKYKERGLAYYVEQEHY